MQIEKIIEEQYLNIIEGLSTVDPVKQELEWVTLWDMLTLWRVWREAKAKASCSSQEELAPQDTESAETEQTGFAPQQDT